MDSLTQFQTAKFHNNASKLYCYVGNQILTIINQEEKTFFLTFDEQSSSTFEIPINLIKGSIISISINIDLSIFFVQSDIITFFTYPNFEILFTIPNEKLSIKKIEWAYSKNLFAIQSKDRTLKIFEIKEKEYNIFYEFRDIVDYFSFGPIEHPILKFFIFYSNQKCKINYFGPIILKNYIFKNEESIKLQHFFSTNLEYFKQTFENDFNNYKLKSNINFNNSNKRKNEFEITNEILDLNYYSFDYDKLIIFSIGTKGHFIKIIQLFPNNISLDKIEISIQELFNLNINDEDDPKFLNPFIFTKNRSEERRVGKECS